MRFDADAAKALHEGLYRQKLASLLEKKRLTDEDDAGACCAGRARACCMHMFADVVAGAGQRERG